MRDIGVTLIITSLAFLTNPITRAYQILHIRDDMGILGGLTITAFALIESLLIRTQHYWKWVVLSTLTVTAAAFISRGFPENYTFLNKVDETVVNGLIFLLFSIPSAAIVYFIKKKVNKGCS